MNAAEVLEITAKTLQVLGRIGAEGAGRAAQALSGLIGEEVRLAMPTVGMVALTDLPRLYPSDELE